jgi:hypothetical protein
MEFSPESRYDWTNLDERWKWLGVKRGQFDLNIVVAAGLQEMTPRLYIIDMLENNELRGKAKKDAQALKDNSQLEWGFK